MGKTVRERRGSLLYLSEDTLDRGSQVEDFDPILHPYTPERTFELALIVHRELVSLTSYFEASSAMDPRVIGIFYVETAECARIVGLRVRPRLAPVTHRLQAADRPS